MSNDLPKQISEREVYSSYVHCVEEELLYPNGIKKKHFAIRHPGAVVVIAVDRDGTFILLEQYRHTVGKKIFEVVAGGLVKGEDPLEAAKRELAEEGKVQAEEWIDLGSVYPVPGYSDELQYMYLAKNLSKYELDQDEDEIIDIHRVSKERFVEMIHSGEIVDSKTITAFFLALRWL